MSLNDPDVVRAQSATEDGLETRRSIHESRAGQDAREVELARERGVDARVGDTQSFPFADASFDTVVAA